MKFFRIGRKILNNIPIPNLWKILLRTIEVVAAIGAVFAFYEIFFARKTVSYYSAEIDLCRNVDIDQYDLAEFLASNNNTFAYLTLNLSQQPLNCTQRPPFEAYSSILGPDISAIIVSHEGTRRGEETVKGFNMRGNASYLTFNVREMRNEILATVREEWEENPGFLSIEGIFFVRSYIGEGDLYFELLPAPFDIQTDRLSRCTKALQEGTLSDRTANYLRHCIL